MMRLFVSTFTLLALGYVPDTVYGAEVNELGQESYHIDSSWAITSDKLASTFGDKQKLYDDYMAGCREMAGEKKWACDDSYRIQMNRDQPRVSQRLNDGRGLVAQIVFVGRRSSPSYHRCICSLRCFAL
jgi:hypothetical protein